jgi:hypothetical protein
MLSIGKLLPEDLETISNTDNKECEDDSDIEVEILEDHAQHN